MMIISLLTQLAPGYKCKNNESPLQKILQYNTGNLVFFLLWAFYKYLNTVWFDGPRNKYNLEFQQEMAVNGRQPFKVSAIGNDYLLFISK